MQWLYSIAIIYRRESGNVMAGTEWRWVLVIQVRNIC